MENKVVVIGDEFDSVLLTRLLRCVESLGGVLFDPPSYLVGGSQESHTWRYKIASEIVTIETETYIGLSLHGSANVVDRILGQIQAG